MGIAPDAFELTENDEFIVLQPSPDESRRAPPQSSRAPEFNEHGDAILESLGLDWDTIIDLKIRNVVA